MPIQSEGARALLPFYGRVEKALPPIAQTGVVRTPAALRFTLALCRGGGGPARGFDNGLGGASSIQAFVGTLLAQAVATARLSGEGHHGSGGRAIFGNQDLEMPLRMGGSFEGQAARERAPFVRGPPIGIKGNGGSGRINAGPVRPSAWPVERSKRRLVVVF